MKTKHTQGEWKAKDVAGAGWEIFAPVGAHDFIEYKSVSDDFEAPIFKLIGHEPWHQFPQKKWEDMQEANAKLIAAAPELLEALDDLVEVTKNHPNFVQEKVNGNRWAAVSRAKKAIKKAIKKATE